MSKEPPPPSSFVNREVKKYKTKNKTEPILSIFEAKDEEARPKSIISKINELQLDAESWRKRVPDNDAKQFTVASKLDSKLKTNLTENIQAYLAPGSNINQIKKLASENQQQQQSIEEEEEEGIIKREKTIPDYRRVILNRNSPEIIKQKDEIRSNDALIESLKSIQAPKQQQNKLVKSQRVELFSTDSELDSFFKENESLIKKSGYDSSRDFRADVDVDVDDLDFDRMVTNAQR